MASLATGGLWFFTGARLFRLNFLGTIYTGVLALLLGFVIIGFFWLSLDVSRPAPKGVDERTRGYQLFFLWLGIPLIVLGVVLVVGLVAIVVGATVLKGI